MIVRILFIIMPFLFAVKNSHQPIIHPLEFVKEEDKIAILIDRLYLSSKILPKEVSSFYTITDVEEDLKKWNKINQNPTTYQRQLIDEIKSILENVQHESVDFSKASFTPTIRINSGFDYIYHKSKSNHQEDSLYFNVFRDRDLWVMGFHPEDEANELIDDGTFEGETDTAYALLFVQRLSKLEKAAEKLRPLGYYDKYFQEYDVADMYELRTNFYRRLQDARC